MTTKNFSPLELKVISHVAFRRDGSKIYAVSEISRQKLSKAVLEVVSGAYEKSLFPLVLVLSGLLSKMRPSGL